jgi:glycyl-tRNA synthetase
MAQQDKLFQKIVAHCKEYGFIFPSSEIYEGLGGVYDYGPNGVALKRHIQDYWWRSMVQLHENIVGLDAAIFMHPKTWKASGHTEQFNDPLIDNKDSKKRYRVDELLERKIHQYRRKDRHEKADRIQKELNECMKNEDLDGLYEMIQEYDVACPVSGSKEWTKVRQFNLMFETQWGSISEEDDDKVYLRPETAQGIFVDYINVQKTNRMKVPFGIAQMGKAFRNEIVARQFIFRMREFEQLEMEYFIRPGTEEEWYEYWKEQRMQWHQALGISADRLRFEDHEQLSHYEEAGLDIEYEFPIGWEEVEGIHSRTDYDLTQHQEHSGKKLQYFDPQQEEKYLPYVVETSLGLDRMFLMVLSEAYQEHELDNGKQRIFLQLPAPLAPVKFAVLPLVNKDGLPEKGREVMNQLKLDYTCHFEAKGSIGKRYRRQDAIGTPYCITIDHQTLEDDTVTIRYRDDMSQDRVPVSRLAEVIRDGMKDWKPE